MGDKGNPEQAATLEEQVRDVVKKLEVTDDGQVKFPEELKDLPDDVKYAATLEQRRLATQASYTKGQQRLKQLQAEKELLESKVGVFSPSELKELDELKYEDPDEWYKRKQELETQKKEELNQSLNEVGSKAAQEAELERRVKVLEEFNASHPDFQLSDEIIQYDVPPRITRQLEKGEISFEQFLNKSYNYLAKPKKVGDANKPLEQPNLGKLGGGNTPSEYAGKEDFKASYKKTIF